MYLINYKIAHHNYTNQSNLYQGTVCFTIGTLIETKEGLKAIETFTGGELIWTRNDITLELGMQVCHDVCIGASKGQNNSKKGEKGAHIVYLGVGTSQISLTGSKMRPTNIYLTQNELRRFIKEYKK